MISNVSVLRTVSRLLMALTTGLACSTLMAAPPSPDAGICREGAPRERGPLHGLQGEREVHPLPPPLFMEGARLSEEQADRVFVIQHEFALQIHEKRRQLEKAMRALHELPYAEKFDEVRARELATAAASAMGDLALLEARRDARVFAVLDAEQRKASQETGAPNELRRRPPRQPEGDRPRR